MICETDIATIRLSQNCSHEGTHTKDQKKIKGKIDAWNEYVFLKFLEYSQEKS